jgi:hypothetical protein
MSETIKLPEFPGLQFEHQVLPLHAPDIDGVEGVAKFEAVTDKEQDLPTIEELQDALENYGMNGKWTCGHEHDCCACLSNPRLRPIGVTGYHDHIYYFEWSRIRNV